MLDNALLNAFTLSFCSCHLAEHISHTVLVSRFLVFTTVLTANKTARAFVARWKMVNINALPNTVSFC